MLYDITRTLKARQLLVSGGRARSGTAYLVWVVIPICYVDFLITVTEGRARSNTLVFKHYVYRLCPGSPVGFQHSVLLGHNGEYLTILLRVVNIV